MKKQLILILFLIQVVSCLLSQQNIKAEYYNGTNFEKYVGSNFVSNIDFFWNHESPIKGLNPNKCSVRYTGQIHTSKSGTYTFSARVDDGIRVWIDDILIMSNWKLNDVGYAKGEIDLIAHKNYNIKIEYFNALLEAEIRLLWTLPDDENQSWLTNWWNRKPVVIATDYFLPSIDKKEQSLALLKPKVEEKPEPYEERPEPKVEEISEATVEEKPESKFVKKRVSTVADKPLPKDVKKPVAQALPTPKPVSAESPVVLSQKDKTPDTLLQYIPKNVEFERAKSEILSISYPDLNKLASFLANNPSRKVIIEGHTDSVGDSAKNLILSKERAKAIELYFIHNGVRDSQIISAIGYGGTKPIVPSDGIKHHPENRRVEFILK